MHRDRGSFLTSRGAAGNGGVGIVLLRGALLACLALGCVSCLAQQADLVRLETEFSAKLDRMAREKAALADAIKESREVLRNLRDETVKARAQIKSDLRTLRDKDMPQARGELETELNRKFTDELGELGTRMQQRDDNLESRLGTLGADMESRVDALGSDLESRLVTLGDDMNRALEQRDETVQEQFAGFRDSLVQFKGGLEQVDAQLQEEQNRAAAAELALREKLDADAKSLKTYLATDVQNTIGDINAILETNERTVREKLDAQGEQLSEIRKRVNAELESLRGADLRHGNNVDSVAQALAELREALDSVVGKLGERSDDHTKRLEVLEQSQTARGETFEGVSERLDAAAGGMESLRDSLQVNVKHVNQVTASVEQLHEAVRRVRADLDAVVAELESRTAIEVPDVPESSR